MPLTVEFGPGSPHGVLGTGRVCRAALPLGPRDRTGEQLPTQRGDRIFEGSDSWAVGSRTPGPGTGPPTRWPPPIRIRSPSSSCSRPPPHGCALWAGATGARHRRPQRPRRRRPAGNHRAAPRTGGAPDALVPRHVSRGMFRTLYPQTSATW